MLKKWRDVAERRARFYQEHGPVSKGAAVDLSTVGLAESKETITSLESENEIIGDAIKFSCVPEIWGHAIADCVRDFTIEFARNAFQHGSATTFELEISPSKIRLNDDGQDFDIWRLPDGANPRGGALALKALVDRMSDRIIIASQRVDRKNEIVISRVADANDIEELTPCVAYLSWEDVREGTYQIIAPDSCRVVYVILPEYWTPSNSIKMVENIRQECHDPRRLTFILQDTSETSRAIIANAFPLSRIIHV